MFSSKQSGLDGDQQKQRQFHHASEAAGLLEQTVEPFQIQTAEELGRTLYGSGEYIQRTTQTTRQRNRELVHVTGHKALLLGGTEAGKHNIGSACGLDRIDCLLIVLKVAVLRAGDDQSGIFLFDVLSSLFSDTRLGTEQEQTHSFLRHAIHECVCKVDTGHLAGKRNAQNAGSINDANAVGQNKRGTVNDIAEDRILERCIYDFRVGGYDITLFSGADLIHCRVDRVFECDIMKSDT